MSGISEIDDGTASGLNPIEIGSGPRHRARVWTDRIPGAYLSDEVVRGSWPASAKWKPSRVAVEHTWGEPYVRYGLLGAEFTPSESRRLDVEIHVSPDVPRPQLLDRRDVGRWLNEISMSQSARWFHSPLAWAEPNCVGIVGLPKEFVSAILSGFEEHLARLHELGSGTLRIANAVNGIEGSSQLEFLLLTRMVLWLVSASPSEEEVRTGIFEAIRDKPGA